MKKKKGERIEIPLPEAMIQHIQSFLTRKEAARTTILSKSWYNAWLTRPALDFDDRNFSPPSSDLFKQSAMKTMQMYLDSGLKIESFRLRSRSYPHGWAHGLIVNAMKIGAHDVDIKLRSYTLPREVVGSETLLRLSVSESKLIAEDVSCSRLKSLSLDYVTLIDDDELKHIVSCCNSLEELSLSSCYKLTISRMNLYELHKLKHLSLYTVNVDSMFFTNFDSRFPCLKDLSILECHGCERVHISSISLETISFNKMESSMATFDVPNIRKFTYWAYRLPRLSINGASREWKFDISIICHRFNKPSWFQNLKKLLAKFRLSRISLSMKLQCGWRIKSELEVDVTAVAEPLVVENLTINAPSSFCCALLVRMFGICRPKFITHYWLSDKCKNASLAILCKRLVSGQFDLKKVKMEVYEMIYEEWRPLVLKKPLDASETPVWKRKTRFELIWD